MFHPDVKVENDESATLSAHQANNRVREPGDAQQNTQNISYSPPTAPK